MPIELIWGPPPTPSVPTTVVVSGVTVTVLGTSSVRIDLDLTPDGKAFVEYDSSVSGALTQATAITSTFLGHHAITITGLSPGVVYRYRVVGISTDGEFTYDSEGAFATTSDTILGTVYGYAAGVTGGAGGVVCEVDNNNSSGSGSFLDAANTSGPRIITFAVDGIIHIPTSNISPRAFCTIAGETSGGDGITFTGRAVQCNGSGSSDVIMRQFRNRGWVGGGAPPANTGSENFGAINSARRLVFQNLSGAWHADETIGFYRGNQDVTIQDCILGEGIYSTHNFACLVSNNAAGISSNGETTRISIFRNLMYRSQYRNPNVGYAEDPGPYLVAPAVQADIANNLIWPGSVSGSYGPQVYFGGKMNARYNYVGNTTNAAISWDDSKALSQVYSEGNFSRNGRSTSGNVSTPFLIPTAATLPMFTDARTAAEYVLDHAGCRIGGLDSYDANAISAILSAGL